MICTPACGAGQYCDTNMTCQSYGCDTVCSASGGGSWSDTYQQCMCNTVEEPCGTACLAQAADFYYNSTDSTYCCDFKCSPTVVCKTASELNMYTGGTIANGTLATMKSGTSASYE